jgi:nucleotide-binding universal stress UspA family protein
MLGYADMAGAVFDPLPEMVEAQHEGAKNVLKAAAAAALALGIEADTQIVDNAFPAEGIIAVAEKVATDLIVMGSHGRRGFGRLLLGSQTNEVLAHSKVPVLVIR